MERAAGPDSRVERRIVSVLFADLVGFTTLAERLDAEDVGTIQDAYFATVTDTIHRYGGQLEKFIGDAAMAVFGLPLTRDDDAERAVRAGLALVNSVEALAGRIGLETGGLRIRVGINTGEVVTPELGRSDHGTAEGRVTGDAVNTAARLQTAAPPGRVLLGEATALAVTEAIELEPAEAILLKGKAAPVRASLAVAVRPVRSREIAMGRLRAPLIGRTDSLAVLARFAERAIAGGSEQVLLSAPPGVGKTRLVEELLARLPGVHVLRARLRADALSPFEAVVQLLSGGLERDRPWGDRRAQFLGHLLRAGVPAARAEVVLEDIARLLAPSAVPINRPTDRAALFDGWATVLDAIDADRPAVWFIEDLHWADPDLLEFLAAAHARTRSRGRLILATARPAILERVGDAADGGAGPAWPILDLATLDPGNTADLVAALVGPALPGPLVARIVDGSDGNPLFIEELLRTWVNVGTLVAEDADRAGLERGGWRLTVPAESAPLPTTVQAIYAAQLDDLPSAARTAARRASVAGRRFPMGSLEALGVPDIPESLAILRGRALIAGPQADPITGDAYSFRHALLRDAGYASLSRAERARLHVRLARWLEQVAGDRVVEVAEAIGGHFEAALESTPALATEVGDGLDRPAAAALAAHWLERAGDLAQGRFAYETARSLFARSVALSPEEPGLALARRLCRLGEATVRAADLDEAASILGTAADRYRSVLLDDALPAATRDDARRGLGAAAAAQANVRYEQMRFGETRTIAEAALELTGRDDPSASVPLFIARLNGLEGLTNDYATLFAEAEQVVMLARATEDPDLVFNARRVALGLSHGAGMASADDWLDFGSEAAGLGRWEAAAAAMINGAGLLAFSDRDRLRRVADQAQAISEARGLSERLAWIGQVRCELELEAGGWIQAQAEGIRALDLAAAKGYDRVAVRTWFALTPVAAARQDDELLRRAATWFVERSGTFPTSPYGNVNRAAVDLRLAAAGLAEPPVLDPATLFEGFDLEEAAASWVASIERIVEGWLERGDVEVAAEAVGRYSAVAVPAIPPILAASRALVRCLVVARSGGRAEAAEAARTAVDRARAAAAPWWVSRSLRLLEAAGGASVAEIAEAARIESDLGIATR